METGDAPDGTTPDEPDMEGGDAGDGSDSAAVMAEGGGCGGTGDSCTPCESHQRGETGDVPDCAVHPHEPVLAEVEKAGECDGADAPAHVTAAVSECGYQGVLDTSKTSEADKKADEPAPRSDLPALSKSALGAAQTPPPPPPIRERALRFVFTRLGLAP
ncbi:unnamed protein product [Symbiodinium natans]|uniref:Uncharacterized protein n=1 Tax=Symbiodinium natans TaxID=878477 RepID=A0A812KDS1_9DINO|nr:unnamed protein product [Symbiodinium natans]